MCFNHAVAIPEFNQYGDLPTGVHKVSIRETLERFAASTLQRRGVGLRLERIYAAAMNSGYLWRFIVFGSFVTAKPEPKDVDIFMIMNDEFDVTKVEQPASALFDHATAQSLLGASVF